MRCARIFEMLWDDDGADKLPEAVAQHVALCVHCRARLQEWQRIHLGLSELRRIEAPPLTLPQPAPRHRLAFRRGLAFALAGCALVACCFVLPQRRTNRLSHPAPGQVASPVPVTPYRQTTTVLPHEVFTTPAVAAQPSPRQHHQPRVRRTHARQQEEAAPAVTAAAPVQIHIYGDPTPLTAAEMAHALPAPEETPTIISAVPLDYTIDTVAPAVENVQQPGDTSCETISPR